MRAIGGQIHKRPMARGQWRLSWRDRWYLRQLSATTIWYRTFGSRPRSGSAAFRVSRRTA